MLSQKCLYVIRSIFNHIFIKNNRVGHTQITFSWKNFKCFHWACALNIFLCLKSRTIIILRLYFHVKPSNSFNYVIIIVFFMKISNHKYQIVCSNHFIVCMCLFFGNLDPKLSDWNFMKTLKPRMSYWISMKSCKFFYYVYVLSVFVFVLEISNQKYPIAYSWNTFKSFYCAHVLIFREYLEPEISDYIFKKFFKSFHGEYFIISVFLETSNIKYQILCIHFVGWLFLLYLHFNSNYSFLQYF